MFYSENSLWLLFFLCARYVLNVAEYMTSVSYEDRRPTGLPSWKNFKFPYFSKWSSNPPTVWY